MKKIEGKSIVSYEKIICNKHKYDKHNITFPTHTLSLFLMMAVFAILKTQ